MNRIQEENRSLRIKRETKSPTLQKRAKYRRINEAYREVTAENLSNQAYFEALWKELEA
jgi:hypothetical protein